MWIQLAEVVHQAAPSDIFFRRNQDLQFVDRLPGSGEVRTTNMARRTDAPLPPGDEIFNSPDDAFYGGLQAGNDGIYGTMDDFYETTRYRTCPTKCSFRC